MNKCKTIMIQGTGSNVGKSIIVTGLCRILKEDGFRVAPFKAQNMSLNSFVTKKGLEMGRAQVTQAIAAKVEPDVRMNPVLLKPNSDNGSQVILNGKPIGNFKAKNFYQSKKKLLAEALKAFNSLAQENEIIVLEGAGSCAEINLRENDIVNMGMAQAIHAPVLIVGDIDKGGVFAHFIGTYEVLDIKDQNLIKGFLINKFRGDKSLLNSAIDFVTKRTNVPILGILDWMHDLKLPEEDSVEYSKKLGKVAFSEECTINIAVIALPHMSNFTDFDPFEIEADVNITFINSTDEIEKFDVIIIPGTKNTIADYLFLEQKGFVEVIRRIADEKRIVGICGGYQILGKEICDPKSIESATKKIEALALLNHSTEIVKEKYLSQTKAIIQDTAMNIKGYEIHHGQTISKDKSFIVNSKSESIGTVNKNGNIWGTYLHGVFENDNFRNFFLNDIRLEKGKEKKFSFFTIENELDKLTSLLRKNLDMEKIYRIIGVK